MDNYENPRPSEQSGGLPGHENSDNGDEKKRRPRKRIPLKPELQRTPYEERTQRPNQTEKRYDDDMPRFSRSEEFGPSVYEPRRPSLPERRQTDISDRYNSDRPYQPRQNGGNRPSYGEQRQQQGERRGPARPRPGAPARRDGGYQGGGQRQGAPGGSYPRQGGRPGMIKKSQYPGRPGKKILKPRSAQDEARRRADAGFPAEIEGEIRLNKYISYAGICSRREADKLIEAGAIKVNGEIVTTLGSRVIPGDKVQYGDETLSFEKKYYVLLNKPKGYLTTTEDPGQRKTVMSLVDNACRERIYPVGRLDRNTTGLLLFTNDGLMAKKLMHPAGTIRKLYHVVLDKPLTHADIDSIADGVQFEQEGEVVDIDDIAYAAEDKREIGIAIHSGQNRVVRRIFEKYGYKVNKLDRVMYAGLTKKNLGRGRWRYLSEQEVNFLRML